MKKDKFKLVFIIMIALVIASSIMSLCWGTYKVTPMEVINTFLGNGTRLQNTVVLSMRLPRLLVAI